MRSFSLAAGLVVALGAAVWLPLRALADDRLAGYWVPAPGEAPTATFTFGILGRWTFVSAHWDGSAPDFKVRYTVATSGASGASGTLTADEKLDRQPEAPHTLSYAVKGGELFLTIPDTTHAGRYHLVKGEPPAAASAAAPSEPASPREARPGPPRSVPPAVSDPNAVLGGWATEPGSSVQVVLFIAMASPKSVKINQEWANGSDAPVSSQAGVYAVNFTGAGRGVFSKDRPDYEGSEVPLHLEYAIDGNALVITVGEGTFAGQYRLVRKRK
jgi:hypothetical protein